MADDTFDKFRGGILGVAVGDALGVPVEFMGRVQLRSDPVTGMRGPGTHNQPPGTWSDDTSMTLCLLDALEQSPTNPDWQLVGSMFCEWLFGRRWTPHGRVFDVGGTTREALMRVSPKVDAREAGLDNEWSCGNGSLMRTLPIPLMLGSRPVDEVAQFAEDASRITHAHPRCRIACAIYSVFARALLNGDEPSHAWESTRRWALDFYENRYAAELRHFDKFLQRSAVEFAATSDAWIEGSGYVVESLEAGLWCLLTTSSYRECCLKAVNLGIDTDTTGAVAGGLAGVHYGVDAIPADWLNILARRQDIDDLISRAFVASST